MANVKAIDSFIFKGIKNLLAFERGTGDLAADITYLTDVKLNDSTEVDYLRGGPNMGKIIPILGERNPVLEAANASNSLDLMEIMSSNKMVVKEKIVDTVEVHTIEAGKITLNETPEPNQRIILKVMDEFGVNRDELTLGDPGTEELQYSIIGAEVTVNDNLKGTIKAYYRVKKEVQNLELKTADPKSYRFVGIAYCEDVKTRKQFEAIMEIGNGQIQPNVTYDLSNTAGVPDAVPLTIDILEDPSKPGVPVELSFIEEKQE